MNKSLIAIVSARHRHEWRHAIRGSWMPQVPRDRADVFFFVGRYEGKVAEYMGPDVIELDCSDAYEHLPEKIRAIAKWAADKEYAHLLKCDDDVVLRPHSLLDSGYNLHDYSGRANRPPQPYIVPCGFNYWLSNKSMEIVSSSELPEDGSLDDEKWVAKNLWEHGIALHDDRRYYLHQWLLADPEPITRRPLRAPKRPVSAPLEPYGQAPGTFSWCVHLCAEMDVKLHEFSKLFLRHGEK